MHGLVPAPFEVEPVLLDIEELNRRAAGAELELSKLSFGAAAAAGDRYRLLRSGAALGHGVGPLVVAREPGSLEACGGRADRRPGPRDDRVPAPPARGAGARRRRRAPVRPDPRAVVAGEVDAGLIIHESRFTYGEHGLVAVADLGEWWEGDTGLPVPLAGIFARSDLEPELVEAAEAAVRASVEYAFANPEASRDYVRSLSHEMSDEVCAAHIALYVNEHSVDIGDEGMVGHRPAARSRGAAAA